MVFYDSAVCTDHLSRARKPSISHFLATEMSSKTNNSHLKRLSVVHEFFRCEKKWSFGAVGALGVEDTLG